MSKKALIVGAAGFVGPYLARCLLENGWEVWATKLPHEQLALDGATVCDLDILDASATAALLESIGPDGIFHLAAQSSVALSWAKPDLTIDINIKGASHLLEAARQLKKKPRVLLIGSSEEYGLSSGGGVISEDHPVTPANYYAATKVCQEMIGALYCRAYDMDVMCTRSFNHIGPGQSPVFVVSDFCRQVAQLELQGGGEIRVGNLAAKRDFTDVRDVVRAYVLLIEKGRRGQIYNVGSGRAIAIEELLRDILSLSNASIRVVKDAGRFRPVDIPVVEADISRLKNDTGWTPEINVQDTIAETLNYWRIAVKG